MEHADGGVDLTQLHGDGGEIVQDGKRVEGSGVIRERHVPRALGVGMATSSSIPAGGGGGLNMIQAQQGRWDGTHMSAKWFCGSHSLGNMPHSCSMASMAWDNCPPCFSFMARSNIAFATLISPGCTLPWFAFDFLRPLFLQSAVANSVAMTTAVSRRSSRWRRGMTANITVAPSRSK